MRSRAVVRGGEVQSPEDASEQDARVNASMRARAAVLPVPRGAGVSLQPGLLPPAPLPRRAVPPSFPIAPPRRARRWDAPAEQAAVVAAASLGTLGSVLRGRSSTECLLSRLGGVGPASHGATPCQNFVAAAAKRSEPGQRAGGRGAGPGQAGRGVPSAAAPARGPTMPQLGGGRGGGAGGGGGGSGAGAASGGDDLGANDELIPFQDEGGEEQEPSSDSASAQRDLDEVKSSLVNESENQSSSSDSEVKGFLGSVPLGDPGPAPAHPRPSPLCLSPPQAERRPQPARDAFQKPRDYFAEGTCLLLQSPLSGRQRSALPVPMARVAEPLFSSHLCSDHSGAHSRGTRVPDSRLEFQIAVLSRGPLTSLRFGFCPQ